MNKVKIGRIRMPHISIHKYGDSVDVSNAINGTIKVHKTDSNDYYYLEYKEFRDEVAETIYDGEGNVMGVDLGIKCPAVSYASDGNVNRNVLVSR